ncbi:MAG: DUF1800 domain-containing protein [Saprospiraceae bacterium]|nr:DUF1800 domain-containing protein [Saprospiraceae bacterium]
MNKQQRLQHLYWRSGFGMSPKEWFTKKNHSTQIVIDELFRKAHQFSKKKILKNERGIEPSDILMILKLDKKEKRRQNKIKIETYNIDWILRSGNPKESALLEKMILFWHGHFACRSKVPEWALKQLNTIRRYALGNFKELVLAMAKDGSMIRFLNNQQNKKRKPNENFARELMELFTIGRGNYSEKDVKEAARAFTGWSSNLKGDFVFKKRQHDFGEKIFFEKKGKWDGDDIIDMILEKRETAEFIARKAYRFFVNEKIEEQNVKYLARVFYDSNYNIEKLMRAIFESKWFFEKKNVGVKIKSPIELIAGMIRIFEVDFKNPAALIFIEKALGQVLFHPPNVAGWAGGKNWIDNSTLMLRLNLANVLFQNSELNLKIEEAFEAQKKNKQKRNVQASVNFTPFYNLFKRENEKLLLNKMGDFILQTKGHFKESTFENFIIKNNKEDLVKTMCLRMMSLPEYQLM